MLTIGILVTSISVFFFRLFWPTPQLILTPDFGRSDAWDFSFGMKYALWDGLQNRTLPLWDHRVGDGFPLLAEGQTGALFLPNLIIFSLPSPVLAYNVALVFALVTMTGGMYWWSRLLGFSRKASLFGALTLGFSGLPILHLTHITLLQAMSLFPILAAITKLLATRRTVWLSALFALVASQQLFAGFPQATFLTFLFCGAYCSFLAIKNKSPDILLLFLLALFLTFGLGGAQLLPSWEFLKETTNPSGFDRVISSYFSFPIKHLVTFLDPFTLGNPKFGTYPDFSKFDGSIFWENTAYLGILPLAFAAVGLFIKRRQMVTRFFLWTCVVSLLLAWGKYSPLYFLYTIWPLTLFRVPSRFLWIVVAAVIMLAIQGADLLFRIIKRHTWSTALVLLVMGIHTGLLLSTWWSYHLLIPAATWLAAPETLPRLSAGRTFTVGSEEIHNRFFLSNGWKSEAPYIFLRQGFTAEGNIVWNVVQHEVTSGRPLRRSAIVNQLFTDTISVTPSQATFSAQTNTFLKLFSIRNVLSFLPLDAKGLTQTASFTKDDITVSVYDNPASLPRAYVVYEATQAATLTQAADALNNPSFSPGETVLLESHEVRGSKPLQQFVADTKQGTKSAPPTVSIQDGSSETTVTVNNNPIQALLVLSDTHYPGWVARIDGTPTAIFTANLAQRAVLIPEGSHTVTFRFEPKSFFWGVNVSSVFLLLTMSLMIAPIFSGRLHIGKKARGLAYRLRYNRGR